MRHIHLFAASCALLAGALGPQSARAWCWNEAGQAYAVSPQLLYAIARAESDLNPAAVNRSHRERTGTYDIGLMQINSGHLKRLETFGIGERELYEPCTNIKVGAWLLAGNFARYGVSWDAVGAYNAACGQLKGPDCTAARSKYAWRVYRRLPNVSTAASAAATPGPAPQPASAPIFILSARVSP